MVSSIDHGWEGGFFTLLPVPQVSPSLLWRVKPSTHGSVFGEAPSYEIHLLVEDRRQEEILTKLTIFKNQYVPSVQYLVLPHLIPGGVGGLGCEGGWVPLR